MRPRPNRGGGWPAHRYIFRMARKAGGFLKLYRAMRSRNACKTCALGMGGQRGGMVNERGRFPEVCKKSLQAMVADMQGAIAPEFLANYGFDALRQFSPRELEASGRIAAPLYAGPDDRGYRVISWDEALDRCVARLKSTPPDQNFFYFSGRSSNEAAFLWQLFARLYGTNNVNNCSYYCHQASGVGLGSTLGSGTATISLDDLEQCDLIFVIGGNPASNHPRLMTMLADVRNRGGGVVVVNPLRETGLVNFAIPSRVRSMLFGSPIASEYVQPHIGGDIAFIAAVAKRVDALGAVDHAFLRDHTEDAETFLAFLRGLDDETLIRESGVSAAEIDLVARLYARSRNTIFSWTMGITHHVHGVDNVRAIVNLALLRGMVGRPGAGLLPIRGHSNVQGVGSVGVTPKLRDAIFERLQTSFGVKLPTTPGMDTLACIDAMRAGKIRNAWCLGGNLYGSNPDARQTATAFEKLEFVTYLSTTLNTGHTWGRAKETLILPVKARDEERQATTQESMFNYVRLSDGGPERIPQARSEVEVVAALARCVLPQGPIDWTALEQHRNIRAMIAQVIPGYEPIGAIDATRREFEIGGRVFHEPKFPRPSGRARFSVTPIPRQDRAAGEVRLMTIRSEGQFNTVVYEEEDIYRHQERRDVILLNAADMRRLGIREDQTVVVRNDVGEMRVLAREFAIREGNAAMYYPEANELVARNADPESRTPAFKAVRVTITPFAENLTVLISDLQT